MDHDTMSGSFDFDKWLENNRLSSIKSLFIEHDMCALSTLSMNNGQFANFMAALAESQPHIASQVVLALQQLKQHHTVHSPVAQLMCCCIPIPRHWMI